MNKSTRLLALVTVLMMIIGLVPAAVAEEAAVIDTAYLMYADGSWTSQYWGGDAAGGVVATNAAITGEGTYTIGLDFTGTEQGYAADLAFAAIGITTGEQTMPHSYIRLDEIRVNGEVITPVANGYTSSDNKVETRMNLYNEWVSAVPDDAHCWNGAVATASPIVVDKAAFAEVKTVEVTFTLLANPVDVAYIAFANSDWSVQNWGAESSEAVTVTAAEITGAGEYSTELTFATPVEGLAFSGLMVQNGEITFPTATLEITSILVNGEEIELAKGYTSSDDGITTRVNIFNEWVSELPVDAHTVDGVLDDASPVIVNKDAFTGVTSIKVNFRVVTPVDKAYVAFASADWSVSNWDANGAEGVTLTTADVDGQGKYTTTVELANPAQGIAFMALYLDNGEKDFPGYYLVIDAIEVDGAEIALTADPYTSSDDKIVTRSNIYNEWVAELPTDARRADGNLDNAAAVVVDPAAFASFSKVTVTFRVVYGQPPVSASEALTEEQVAELLAADYNAYIGVQSSSYIFRNMWSDTYGRDDADHEGFFQRLTGWDADSNPVDYGGTFVDALITGNGTYTVSLTTGEMGFGSDESFNLLFVSTEIPSALVKEGYLEVTDVTVKIGDAKTQSFTCVDTTGDYVTIKLIDTYNLAEDAFGYTVPGANTTITITFTVNGLSK